MGTLLLWNSFGILFSLGNYMQRIHKEGQGLFLRELEPSHKHGERVSLSLQPFLISQLTSERSGLGGSQAGPPAPQTVGSLLGAGSRACCSQCLPVASQCRGLGAWSQPRQLQRLGAWLCRGELLRQPQGHRSGQDRADPPLPLPGEQLSGSCRRDFGGAGLNPGPGEGAVTQADVLTEVLV